VRRFNQEIMKLHLFSLTDVFDVDLVFAPSSRQAKNISYLDDFISGLKTGFISRKVLVNLAMIILSSFRVIKAPPGIFSGVVYFKLHHFLLIKINSIGIQAG
jgi:hypothetical protein